MYHRFVIKENKPHPTNCGLLHYATKLWLMNDDFELSELMKWFNHHLQVPKTNYI